MSPHTKPTRAAAPIEPEALAAENAAPAGETGLLDGAGP